jgi:predicted molibdopterin-dependent oxidoreductase YjgC
MIRDAIGDPWREVSWEQAIDYAARRLSGIQDAHGRDSIGGITSSRCTNEEVFVVQKMVRAAFGNNNVDTCARVCHSPTGYGLKQTFGTSAGTQDFKSVAAADVIVASNVDDGVADAVRRFVLPQAAAAEAAATNTVWRGRLARRRLARRRKAARGGTKEFGVHPA